MPRHTPRKKSKSPRKSRRQRSKKSTKKRSRQTRSIKKRTASRNSRSRKWHASIKKNWGKRFHDKLERCVKEVKKKASRNPVYSPYAICFSSLKGTTKHRTGPRKSR